MNRVRTSRTLAPLIVFATLTACSGWGATRYITAFYAYGSDSSGLRTAIAVPYTELQDATGLAALPDGGTPRILKQGMLVYLCNATGVALQSLGFVPQPDGDINVDVRVLAWESDGFDVAFRHYASVPPRFSAFHIGIAGGTLALGAPPDTIQASQAIAPACQRVVDSLRAEGQKRGAAGYYQRP